MHLTAFNREIGLFPNTLVTVLSSKEAGHFCQISDNLYLPHTAVGWKKAMLTFI